MPILELETMIDAPIERVFDLARSIDLHTVSMAGNREKAIAGVTTGLIGLGGIGHLAGPTVRSFAPALFAHHRL